MFFVVCNASCTEDAATIRKQDEPGFSGCSCVFTRFDTKLFKLKVNYEFAIIKKRINHRVTRNNNVERSTKGYYIGKVIPKGGRNLERRSVDYTSEKTGLKYCHGDRNKSWSG